MVKIADLGFFERVPEIKNVYSIGLDSFKNDPEWVLLLCSGVWHVGNDVQFSSDQ